MATISSDHFDRPPLVQVARLLTAADLAALPDELPSGPVRYELDNGNLVMMAPAGEPHSEVQIEIATELKIQGERAGHGKAYTEVGVILWRDPSRVVAPDVCFVTTKSLPVRTSAERYLETIPELVVEVRSKNDTKAYLTRKTADYLSTGVQLLWLVDPDSSVVVEYRPGKEPVTFSKSDILQCDDLIPGFRLAVADLFAK